MRTEDDFWPCLVDAQDTIERKQDEIDRLRARVAELENQTMSEQGIEAMGWMRLPVGADGVPIRPGETVYGADGKPLNVSLVSDCNEFAYWSDGKLCWYAHADECTHEPPERFPLDADGVECHVGDTVFDAEGNRFTVTETYLSDRYDGIALEDERGFRGSTYEWASKFTHAVPDSWERLERDMGIMFTCDYFGAKRKCSTYDCKSCPAYSWEGSCNDFRNHDYIRRARALAGAIPKCSEATPKGGEQ